MENSWIDAPTRHTQKRSSERLVVNLAARLTWKDQRGTARFATVVTRNISDQGIFIECHSPVPLSLYRLVQFQLEREDRAHPSLPRALRDARTLAAVYRIVPPTPGKPQGIALRLMVDPKHLAAPTTERPTADRRATA